MFKYIISIGFSLCFLIGSQQSVYAQANKDLRYSFQIEKGSFKEALNEISKQSHFQFSYNEALVKDLVVEKQIFKDQNIINIMAYMLKGRPLSFSIKGSVIVLKASSEQSHYTISGVITEKQTGESMIAATIACLKEKKGAASNNYGFYSLSLPKGQCIIEISFIGFQSITQTIDLHEDLRLDFELEEQTAALGEVLVKAEKSNQQIDDLKISTQKMSIKTIKSMPALLGETDVLKSLQMLPGVQSGGDASSNLNVRGGSYDQNLILLDDAPIYNPSHALGFFSVFNPDAIKSVEIYKGGIPAQYGDRLSSLVDIRMKEGNMKKYQAALSLGTIASRVSVEGPIVKDKASFIFSGRYSYAGKVADNFVGLAKDVGFMKSELNNYSEGNDISFYDLNLKLNYKINPNNRLYFSAYSGKDQFYFKLVDEKSSMDWGNSSMALRWNHIFNERLFSNTSLIFSNYNYAYYIKDDIRNFKWSSDLAEMDIKSDYDFFLNSRHHIKYGLSVNYHKIQPGEIAPRSENSITKPYKMDLNSSLESALYVSHRFDISDKIALRYGLRYSAFANVGAGIVYNYASDERTQIVDSTLYFNNDIQSFFSGFEPRINLRYTLGESQSIKASYMRTRQYLHLLSNSSLGMPTDIWYPVNKHIEPQTADQLALGYFHDFANHTWVSSVETYYKDMQNQIGFKDNAKLFLNSNVEQEILAGKGRAYGLEFMIKKEKGLLKGWLAYTWSKTEQKIEGINQGKVFPTRYDKTNDLSIYLSYQLSEKWLLSSNFVYSTGAPVTVAKGSYEFQGTLVNYYTERNAYRLPDYHRLDLSLIYKGRKRKSYQTEWIFAVYNVYNRHNAFSVYTKQDDYDLRTNQSYMIYMFGAVPSISFNVKF